MSKLKRICTVCHSVFEAKTANQKYCSTACCDVATYERRKERLKNKQLTHRKACEYCGYLFKPRCESTRFCSKKCYTEWRRREKDSNPAEPPVPGKPFFTWVKEAAECNLDYGTYRGLIAQGKTFDMLKALADSRAPRVHSHSHKIIGGGL